MDVGGVDIAHARHRDGKLVGLLALGWGGWWFWDPVENASFLPWLVGTALLHSAVVIEKRKALKIWMVLLSILTFSLWLLGTFLVRSSVLTSVHAFASDPGRGVLILLLLCLFTGGSLLLFAWRASALQGGGLFAPISREGGLVLNNLFLTTAGATVLIGTLYPLFWRLWPATSSVGAPFFNLTFGPFLVPLIIAMAFAPMLAWKRGDLAGAPERLTAAGVAALIAIAVLWAWTRGGATFAPLAIGLAVFVIAGALSDLVERTALFRAPLATAMSRARGLPRATWGTAFAHAGVELTLIGIVCETTWNSEYIGSMKPNDVAKRRRLSVEARWRHATAGPEFPRGDRPVHRQPRRRNASRDDALEAQLHHAGIIDHRGRIADPRRQPDLRFARRHQRRRRHRRAHLSQAAGAG